jgi:hypothetical protein
VAFVYAFLVLAAFSILMLGIDITALVWRVAIPQAGASLALKALLILGFGGLWLYFNVLHDAQSMEDLAAFVGMLVISVAGLAVTAVLDVLVARRLRTEAKGKPE